MPDLINGWAKVKIRSVNQGKGQGKTNNNQFLR